MYLVTVSRKYTMEHLLPECVEAYGQIVQEDSFEDFKGDTLEAAMLEAKQSMSEDMKIGETNQDATIKMLKMEYTITRFQLIPID